MARRQQSGLEQFRRTLYRTQRGIGDFEAAQRGPGVLAKRIIRRKATGGFFRLLRQAMK